MADRARVTTLDRTCGACPSQWAGTLDDGRVLYIRFRNRELRAGIGATEDEAVEASMEGWPGDPIYTGMHDGWSHHKILGWNHDGYMSDNRMMAIVGQVLDFDPVRKPTEYPGDGTCGVCGVPDDKRCEGEDIAGWDGACD